MALNLIATAKQVIDTEIPASALTIDDLAKQVVTPPTCVRFMSPMPMPVKFGATIVRSDAPITLV